MARGASLSGYVGWTEKRHPSKREALLEDAGNVQGVETRRVGQDCKHAKAVVVLKELVHARGCVSKTCGPCGMRSDTEVLKRVRERSSLFPWQKRVRERSSLFPWQAAGKGSSLLLWSICLICETDTESTPWDPVRTSVAVHVHMCCVLEGAT